MNYPPSLPIGTLYPSAIFGQSVPSRFVSLLTYRWGPVVRAYYIVPILSGLVSEWIPAENITEPLENSD